MSTNTAAWAQTQMDRQELPARAWIYGCKFPVSVRLLALSVSRQRRVESRNGLVRAWIA